MVKEVARLLANINVRQIKREGWHTLTVPQLCRLYVTAWEITQLENGLYHSGKRRPADLPLNAFIGQLLDAAERAGIDLDVPDWRGKGVPPTLVMYVDKALWIVINALSKQQTSVALQARVKNLKAVEERALCRRIRSIIRERFHCAISATFCESAIKASFRLRG